MRRRRGGSTGGGAGALIALFAAMVVAVPLLVTGAGNGAAAAAPIALSVPPITRLFAPSQAASVALPETKQLNIALQVFDRDKNKLVSMDLEQYVLCVLAGEMPSSYEPEALKAQAVAARTLAVFKAASLGGRGCSKRKGADVCTDSGHCQAYKSAAEISSMNADARAKLTAAVYDTAGQVISYGGSVIEVFYHSTSGGVTEDAAEVFAIDAPYLRSVKSPGEEDAPRFQAEVAVSREQFVKLANKQFPKAKLSAKTLDAQLKILSRTAAGRVSSFQLGNTAVSGIEIRKLFSLNSANFTVELGASQVVFHTLGYGHGVGMSQVGANAMARAGSSHVDILTHYYQGAAVGVYGN